MRDLSFKALDGLPHASGGSAVKCNRAIAVHGRTRRSIGGTGTPRPCLARLPANCVRSVIPFLLNPASFSVYEPIVQLAITPS